MNHYLHAVGMMAAHDIGRESRDTHGRPQHDTAAELDALADFGWRMPDVRGFVTTCLAVVSGRRQPASLPRRGSVHLTAAKSR